MELCIVLYTLPYYSYMILKFLDNKKRKKKK